MKLLDLESYQKCHLCPRNCGVNRTAGERGYCGETATLRVASVCAHHGEEPCISGHCGSGTIFFSGCPCRCLYCQNYQISMTGQGVEKTIEQLTREARDLVKRGVHNLNAVTPDHFAPSLNVVFQNLRNEGVAVPLVCNCSGYQKVELTRELTGLFDIFLPDFKYAHREPAELFSRAPDYKEVALAALREMVEAKGFLRPWDETGAVTAKRGVLVRHLVLPGYIENSLGTLQLLRKEFGPKIPLSVMSQYHPNATCLEKGLLNRRLTPAEYRQVCDYIGECGFENVFVQNDFGDDDFLPDFDQDTPFAANK